MNLAISKAGLRHVVICDNICLVIGACALAWPLSPFKGSNFDHIPFALPMQILLHLSNAFRIPLRRWEFVSVLAIAIMEKIQLLPQRAGTFFDGKASNELPDDYAFLVATPC
jgi:hypothetical protein